MPILAMNLGNESEINFNMWVCSLDAKFAVLCSFFLPKFPLSKVQVSAMKIEECWAFKYLQLLA